jgi:hypothetical protein
VTDKGPIYGREAIEKMYTDLFKRVHFSNHVGKEEQVSPHAMGDELWCNGEGVILIKSTAAILYNKRDTIPELTVVKAIPGNCGC